MPTREEVRRREDEDYRNHLRALAKEDRERSNEAAQKNTLYREGMSGSERDEAFVKQLGRENLHRMREYFRQETGPALERDLRDEEYLRRVPLYRPFEDDPGRTRGVRPLANIDPKEYRSLQPPERRRRRRASRRR
jgi:hypothetical protein